MPCAGYPRKQRHERPLHSGQVGCMQCQETVRGTGISQDRLGRTSSPTERHRSALRIGWKWLGTRRHHAEQCRVSEARGRARGQPDARRRRDPSRVEPKYREPQTGETWSGRGRMAAWLKLKEDAGEDSEKYRV